MARPVDDLNWATNGNFSAGLAIGTPSKVDPGAGQKADGWYPNQQPPPHYFNWWQNLVYQWKNYFDEPRSDPTKTYPLASRDVVRSQNRAWALLDTTAAHIDVLVTFGAVIFDNTTGAGAETAVQQILDLPHGSMLSDITVQCQAAAGHTALPDNHKARWRLSRVNIATGVVNTTGLVTDPSASTAAYEAVHGIAVDAGFIVSAAAAFGSWPTTVDNGTYRYVLWVQAEKGTGTTAVNGFKVISTWTHTLVTSIDEG